MEQFFKDLRQYLNTLNIVIKNIGEANWSEQLPLFVSAPYIFNIVSILEQQYALCIAKNNELPTLKLKLFGYLPALPVVFFTLKQYKKKPTLEKRSAIIFWQPGRGRRAHHMRECRSKATATIRQESTPVGRANGKRSVG